MKGHVSTGLGDLAQWMLRYSSAYQRAVGVRLEPGSLNVVLDEPWVMDEPETRLEASEVGVGIGVVSCRLNGVPCWVVRTDKNNSGHGDHDLNVVEPVASTHLRTALGLEDGDEVDLEFGT